ncbi:uncharacterized protein LODBEIA_P28890 [Lodderomyces beijingensis]|uniref:DASH complex subunit SPC19 n=1 Tax=Lodderomyces beijingensis TaxID=1775926 RepID=A0ABP0ZKJ9_9ASCO
MSGNRHQQQRQQGQDPFNASLNNLESCNNSLRESIRLLRNSSALIEESVSDTHRVSKALSTRKVFALVPEHDLEDAKQCYKSNITPQVHRQLDRLQDEVKSLQSKRGHLQSKLKLTRTRLRHCEQQQQGETSGGDSDVDFESLLNDRNYDQLKVRKFQTLRYKKNRLQYTLSRIKSVGAST